jgi:hypothetical protein
MTDPILSTLTPTQLAWVEDQLSNNDVCDDDELRDYFIEQGLTEPQALRALSYRSAYALNSFREGHTPIVRGDDALRFDPHRREFVRWK